MLITKKKQLDTANYTNEPLAHDKDGLRDETVNAVKNKMRERLCERQVVRVGLCSL